MNRSATSLIAFSLLYLSICLIGPLPASVVTTPNDLSPGDQYRLIFVTSSTSTATSSEIGVYNSFVDGIGDTILLSDWKVIASTNAVDAIDNTSTSGTGVPIYDLQGNRITDNYLGLWGGGIFPNVPIYDETGADVGGDAFAWTGSDFDGREYDNSFGLGSPSVTWGAIGDKEFWLNDNEDTSTEELHLYAMSGLLTVQDSSEVIPEPASVISWTALGLLGCMGTWWNRRRRAAGVSS